MEQKLPSISNYIDKNLAPNAVLQPLAYQMWKLMNAEAQNFDRSFFKETSNTFVELVNRFSRSFSGVFGVVIIAFLIILALIIPFTTGSPTELRPSLKYVNYFTQGFILGTDSQGRDVWAVLWHGLRFSLTLSIIVAILDVTLGTFFGVLMGHFDLFDKIFTFIIKIISNIPTLLVLILMTLVLRPSFWVLVLSFILTGWIGLANQVRAQIKRAKNFTWVVASRVLGTPAYKILFNFVPLIIPLLITNIVFVIPGTILGETGLAFIGLSLPNVPTLGNSINSGIPVVTLYPRYVLIPAFFLVLLTSSIQMIGNALQDALRRQR
ncbi:Inner membrane ABC transporter permease protein yejE [Mesomycoplasma conjunctivae]|uniref:Oligopeptide transport system permease protein n=1 Tax=Mesomycoplasma conjunctivae (strain ATCC 25834 / NCTC 10147 / HRC/581) TaxID=572263 RepID=C5J6N2_MESCH|nr:ABC transporter permease [Mesomycoplasma conjunctivae]CAT05138.1 Oligopeptide transport system permease protein [Mesomycoplasma conjunctivae]VEU66153.1 Inner membrane ABC transporter permease protein yejE [Mesomycoplasma conjunctivae]